MSERTNNSCVLMQHYLRQARHLESVAFALERMAATSAQRRSQPELDGDCAAWLRGKALEAQAGADAARALAVCSGACEE